MKVMFYKWHNVQFGGYGWSLTDRVDDANNVFYDSYFVELPEGFYLDFSAAGDPLVFKKDCSYAYRLTSSTTYKNCVPVLVGGDPVEMVRLRVIGYVSDSADDVDSMDFADLRAAAGLTQKEVMERFGIPLITQSFWENGRRVPPDYVLNLFRYWLRKEGYL